MMLVLLALTPFCKIRIRSAFRSRVSVAASDRAGNSSDPHIAPSADFEPQCWPESWGAADLKILSLCPRVYPADASPACKEHYKTQYRVKCNATKPWSLGKFGRGVWPTTVPWQCNVRPMQVSKKPAPPWKPGTKRWKLLIGVMSVAADVRRRQTIRSTWIYGKDTARGPKEIGGVEKPAGVFFVIGAKADATNKLHPPEVLCRLKEEQDKYGDLILLGIVENMNLGKTNDFFQLAYRQFPAEFVMKADADAFINVPSLLHELSFMPSCRLYFGFPCEHPPGNNNREAPHLSLGLKYGSFEIPAGTEKASAIGIQAGGWMCGMGFVLSWDLVEFLATDELVARDASRYASYAGEDIQIGLWLVVGGLDLNFAGDYYKFMDFGAKKQAYTHDMHNDTVLIHEIKKDEQWEVVHSRYAQLATKDQYSTDLLSDVEATCSNEGEQSSVLDDAWVVESQYIIKCTWCLGPGYSCSGCIPNFMDFFTNRSL